MAQQLLAHDHGSAPHAGPAPDWLVRTCLDCWAMCLEVASLDSCSTMVQFALGHLSSSSYTNGSGARAPPTAALEKLVYLAVKRR